MMNAPLVDSEQASEAFRKKNNRTQISQIHANKRVKISGYPRLISPGFGFSNSLLEQTQLIATHQPSR